MRTPMLRQTLLTLGVALAVLAGALLLLTRDANGGEPEGCSPQDLVITEDTAAVDGDGCEVLLTVWAIDANDTEYDLPEGLTVRLPQQLASMVRGSEELSAPLVCGLDNQVDVFDVRAAEYLTPENIALINANPDEFVAWLGEHPDFVNGVLAAVHSSAIVAGPDCPLVPQPEPEPAPPAALPRPPGAAVPAPVAAADPAFTG